MKIRERAHRSNGDEIVRAEECVGPHPRKEPARGIVSGRVRELTAVDLQPLVVLEAGDGKRGSIPLLACGSRDGERIAIHEPDGPPAGGREMLDRKPDAASRIRPHRVQRFVVR
jgi:hypothetical protein